MQGISSSTILYFVSIVMLVILINLIISGEKLHFTKYDFIAILFFVFWLTTSLVSSIWVKNFDKIFINSVYIWNYFLIYLIFRYSLNSKAKIKLISHFPVLIILIYIIIAAYEIITWEHLACSRFALEDYKIFIPTGPFYNENNFAAALLLLSPFVILGLKKYHNPFLKGILAFLVLSILAILTLQGARIAMLAIALELFIFFLFFLNFRKKMLSLGLIMVLLTFLSMKYPAYYHMTRDYVKKEISSIKEEQRKITMDSVKIRIALINESMDLVGDTYFIGVGAGNFEDNFIGDREKNTAGIINSHNFLIEILVSFGILIFFLFLLFYFSLIYNCIKNIKINRNKLTNYMHLFSLLMFIPSSSLPSSIRTHFFYWVMFAYIASYNRIYNVDAS